MLSQDLTPRHTGGRGRPVIGVSWNDAQSYAKWLSDKTEEIYRLPSEAEWEYAARAGTVTRFSWGDYVECGQAAYGTFGAAYGTFGECVDLNSTVAVGSFQVNPFGLYDMHGNVQEWVQDCSHDNYVGAPVDGSAWEMDNCSERVLRGGSWAYSPRYLRSASRFRYAPVYRSPDVGFRLARTL